MTILIEVDGTMLTATLGDGEAWRDFASLLPLALMLEDYASTEQIAQLPRKLSTAGEPAGTNAAVGDFSYYAPWGNLVLFYRPARYAEWLVRLGRIESGVGTLRRSGPLNVKIERLD